MTRILGISAFYHDSAAALVVDGEIVAAAQEERFTRKKHDFNFPVNAISYCLEEAGIQPEELDLVGFYDKPFTKFERLIPVVPQGDAAMAQAEVVHASVDSAGPRWPVPQACRVHRASRVARGERLLPVALRRGGVPHVGWGGGMGDR
jgi:predicted NodU family carbamoyl transferase